ncbi:OmpA family protein [Cyclobacterium marinum]|uniref:OmpA/MotB domain protein n=1 Tax=Cyclobacterium marinum (strain ATCC 25205 / DSM 745 / LMG 13164 / NCIMB 1802) TaxID=880070 RepID=G0J2H1_CYCMS|nr:OmpA family protein [Cyclobacterium marinum]AEL25862.1 OmpA/MotB domain protein [Cyclobacterium marinum DSM 745]MBI0401289.1 PD40 domain-containing protein [Cyclobacterium marinum]
MRNIKFTLPASRCLLPVLLLVLQASCTSLQQKAQTQFNTGEYQLAIASYSKLLENEPDNSEANFYIAESYRLSNRIEKATEYYEKVNEADATFDSQYHKGKSLKGKGEYEEAKKAFEAAKTLTMDDEKIALANKEIQNIDAIADITPIWPNHELENYTLLNSSGLDYAPVLSENQLFFTSSRGAGGMYTGSGQAYTRLFKTRADGINVDVQGVQTLTEFQNESGLNQGAIAISPDGNRIVYARGNSNRKGDLPEVSLFSSTFNGSGFTQPAYMGVNGEPEYWNSTPAFSPDGETLYFASNRPGGYGGTDLYKATKMASGNYGAGVNLGPEINTPGNEMFPRPLPNGEFYFSSDGHPGFGKLDLFVYKEVDGENKVVNLGPNFNSVADDFGIFFTKYPEEGFITSNREGGKGDDDIYFFKDMTPAPKVVNVMLNVVTKTIAENGSEEILPQVRVMLYDDKNETLDGDLSSQSGRLRFSLEPNENYSIIASKTGYFAKSIPYTTVGKTPAEEDLIQDVTNITLDTTIILDQLILERAIVLENIYYDLDKADIRPDAAIELDKLVKILKDNPGIRIELSSHTDARATDAYNDDLSQRRAESAVAYIVSQGISADRLEAKGYGERQLIIENAQTEEEHQINRRTEFKVIEITE